MARENLQDTRREYGQNELRKQNACANPFEQFHLWLEDALKSESYDPTAMVLATIDEKGDPHTRIVLLKDIEDEHLIFFTNYKSSKAKQIDAQHKVALTFYWPVLARQVSICGYAEKTSETLSNDYFAKRPRMNQLGALASTQSEIITDREILETKMQQVIEEHKEETTISRPDSWGGYKIKPDEFEFWQGRDNRLHDRLLYTLEKETWRIERLAP